MGKEKVNIDYSEMNYEGTWSNASLDSVRIDMLLREMNRLIPLFFFDDNSLMAVLNLHQLALEIVSKKPVLGGKVKGAVEKHKKEYYKHKLIQESKDLVLKLVKKKKATIIDFSKVSNLLFDCQYEKQNILRLGLRYEVESNEALDELISNQGK